MINPKVIITTTD